MRVLTPVCLLALFVLVGAGVGQEDKRKKGEDPIKVVKVERKTPILYDKDIEPILINKCAFCHSGNVKEGKLDLASYESMMKGGKRGTSVVPGNSEKSLLVTLSAKIRRPFMPPRSEEALTPEELALIKLWVDQGARAPSGMRVLAKAALKTLPGNVTPVLGVAISPDKSAVAASRANQINIFDAGSGTYVRSLLDPTLKDADKKAVKGAHVSLVESLVYSPDGKYLASGSYQEIALWDAKTGVLLKRVPGFAERVVALAFSHDGKLLATGGGAPTQDGELKIFEVPSGKLALDVKNSHSDTVFGVCFSPDNKLLASCGADKFVKVFEVPTGKLVKSFEGHTHHVLAVGWQGDGKVLASAGADNIIKVWDYAKGESLRGIKGHGKQVTALQFVGKTTSFVTCSGDQTVRMWNTNGGGMGNYSGGGDFLYTVSASPDGALIAAGGQDGVVRVFTRGGGTPRTLLPPGAAPEGATPKKK